MSTHACIVMPYGDFTVYKHFDGYPRAILPTLVQTVGESSIFVRKRDDDPSTMMYQGSEEDLLDEMGYLVSRIITHFAVADYVRRTSTGLKFTPRDYSAVISPTAVCVGINKAVDYIYYIQKNGDVLVENVGGQTKFTVGFKAKVDGILEQLALLKEDDDVDPR